MTGWLKRIRARLKRINGTTNVSASMRDGRHREQWGGPRGGADGGAGGGGLPPT